MSKRLKIQFWRAEKALAMQILEQEGLPKEKTKGDVRIYGSPELRDVFVFLRGDYIAGNSDIGWITFDTDSERDTYLHWAVNSITDELFSGSEELKVGEICEVWNPDSKKWQERKLLAILPENYEERFIVANLCYPNRYVPFSVARPLAKRIEPKIEKNGNVVTYTWEH